MKNEVLVSICCLAYNHQKYITQTIESFLMQEADFDIEILINDDASTDGTKQIIQEYAEKYPNLIFPIFHSENQYSKGKKPLLDFVFPKARGKYIAWCDGDDYWTDPQKLQKQVEVLERNQKASICFHKVRIIDEMTGTERFSNTDQKAISTIYDLAKGNFIYSASCVFRNNLFAPYPDFLWKLPASDYGIHILNSTKGDVVFLDDAMATYRVHSGGIWENKTQIERNIKWLDVQKSLLGKFNKQIDEIINNSIAGIYSELATVASRNNLIVENKEYLTTAIETLIGQLSNEESLAFINQFLMDLKPHIDRTKDYKALHLLGLISYSKNMIDDAILFFADATKINPQLQEAYYYLALSYLKKEEYDLAVSAISANLKIGKNNPEAVILLARILFEKGGMDNKVVEILERLSRNFEGNKFVINKLLCKAYYNLGDFGNAFRFGQIAQALDSNDVEIKLLLARVKKIAPKEMIRAQIDLVQNIAPIAKREEKISKEIPVFQAIQAPAKSAPRNTNLLVSIVIPVFNRLELTRGCIESIYSVGSKYNFEIIVVDNASSDGTSEYLKECAVKYNNFRFLRNNKNLGFSKACNIGIRAADGDYVLLLNNDIIVLENWLDALVDTAESNDSIGIVGSLLLYPDGKTIQHAGVRIASNLDDLAPFHIHKLRDLKYVPSAKETFELNVVTGASMLIRKTILETVGVLDEEFVNSYEDVDFCLRARKAGFKVVYCGASRLIHFESMTPNRHDYDEQNYALFNHKWKNEVDPDIDDRHLFNQFSVWYREEIIKDEKNILYFDKLVRLLKYNSAFEEAAGYEDSLVKLLAEAENTLPFDKDLSFVMIVRNNLEYTKNCIDSIRNSCIGLIYEIIIIDNASDAPTKNYIKNLETEFEDIKAIYNNENKSFAAANNQGAVIAEGKYLFFVNNDIKLIGNAVRSMLKTFEQDNSIGLQGAKLLYPNNTIQHAGIVWGPISEGINLHYHIYLTMPANSDCTNTSREFQFVTGALIAMRHETFLRVRGFCEEYFYGHEDLDLCLKVREIGKKVWYNADAVAYHFESVTKKTEGIEKFERFLTHPNSNDARNHKIFLSKWDEIVRNDADEYFEADGMLAFSSNKELRNSFIARINRVSNALIEFKNNPNKQEQASRLLQLLFAADAFANTNINLSLISESRLKFAEIYLESLESEPFSFDDIFDVEELSKKSEVQPEIFSAESIIKSDKKLKLLMTMYGWNESGGGTTFPKSVAKKLAKEGVEVAVFYATANHQETSQPYFMEYKVEEGVHLYGVYNRPTVFLDADNPEREAKDPKILELFNDLLTDFSPDIVHFNNFLGLSFAIAEMAKSRGFITLYTPYNYHLIDPTLYLYRSDLSLWSSTDFFVNSELPKRNPHLAVAYQNRIKAAKDLLNNQLDYTFAVSSRVRELLSSFCGDASKMTVIHQVHETIDKLLENRPIKRRPEQPIKFGFIGGVMPHKGAHIIVQSAQLLPKGSAEFYIHGFISDQYAALLKSLDRNGVVKIMGEYNSNDFHKITDNLDAIILPSLWEDCAPFVITESLAMKLPVICSRIGGFPDFIKDNFNGRLYTYNSSTELATVLHSLATDPDKITQMQNNCNISFTFDEHIKHLLDVYNRLARGEKPDIEDIKLIF